MKRIKLQLVLSLMAFGLFMGSCSSDEYGNEDYSVDSQVAALKTRVLNIAYEYGIENYQVDESLLRKHLDITDEEIEREMQILAFIPGTYVVGEKEKGHFYIKNKLYKGCRTRVFDDDDFPTEFNGEFSGKDDFGNISVEGDFEYHYDQKGSSNIDATFSFYETITDENGNAVKESCTTKVVGYGSDNFGGNEEHIGMDSYCIIEVKTSTGTKYYMVTYSYTEDGTKIGDCKIIELPNYGK